MEKRITLLPTFLKWAWLYSKRRKSMYEIMICPIKQLYQYAEEGDMSDVAVLAVSSYDIEQERLNSFCNTLCLNFADVSSSTDFSAMSNDVAMKIADYIRKLPKQLDTLFVCCDSGESRSTAMAAALMRFNETDEMKIWRNPHYHPNPLVYKLLCSAFGIQVSDDEVIERVAINNKALSDAING